MRCDRFDDLVATNALVRPGPLDAGMHLVYIRRKRGEEPVRYPHPALREILEPTYGVIVYQEQVMRIANVLAGFRLGEADVLRKAVGKKDAELISRKWGGSLNGRSRWGTIGEAWKTSPPRSRPSAVTASTSRIASPIACCRFRPPGSRRYYPAEFMAALLSSEIGDTDTVVSHINEARELGINVLPPSVNSPRWKFTVTGDREIRFGLGAVKNVGHGAIDSILAGREQDGPYRSLADFCERVDLRACNKRMIESLIAAGAFDQLGGHRAQLDATLDSVLAEAQLRQLDRVSGQVSLFGDASATNPSVSEAGLPEVAPWSEAERLTREKEVIGFFISGHPLERYREEVGLFGTRTTATLSTWSEHEVSVAAIVTAVKRQISRKTGSEYARLTIEDFHGTAEALVFPEAWSRLSSVIVPTPPCCSLAATASAIETKIGRPSSSSRFNRWPNCGWMARSASQCRGSWARLPSPKTWRRSQLCARVIPARRRCWLSGATAMARPPGCAPGGSGWNLMQTSSRPCAS